ncbi:DUF1638 domain-containing protein [Chloroflexota bacterium]
MKPTSQPHDDKQALRIIACRIFRPALEYLDLQSRYPDVHMTYLPPTLHLRADELTRNLRREITKARRANESIICLYGDCFPGIGDYCLSNGATKVPGPHCWEMLLGSERFQHLMDEVAGTYFVEQELILNFEKYCIEPLELHDAEMREYCFKHYHRVVYVRQPSDPDLAMKPVELARFLGLSLETHDADYSHLDRRITGLICIGKGL